MKANKFDDLAMGLAQSATRRQALKKFGIGLAGMALACFGLANQGKAGNKTCLPRGSVCKANSDCCSGICDLIIDNHKGKPVAGFCG